MFFFFFQIFSIDDYIIYEQRLLFLISSQSFIFYFHYLSDSSVGKESACNAGDVGSTPGLERSLEKRKGYPLQYSGLETSMHSSWGHKESDTTEQLSLPPPPGGIFPTQGLNLGLSHCRQILYSLSHQGSPRILKWIAHPFSRGSSQPRDWTQVSRVAGRFFTSWTEYRSG